MTMKILKTETYIKKHTQSNDNIEGYITEVGNMAMGLVNNSELQLFRIEDNIYFTNVDTDFILDIFPNTKFFVARLSNLVKIS